MANSELFGHKKGAFTGATADRKGCFQEASGGTLFLDEVGDLPLDTQVRLLRALQSNEITPMGQSRPVQVNTRIVAATHRNLASDVAAGRFREDLFHRLAVGILQLPPLRERGDDMMLLTRHFLDKINADASDKPEAQQKYLSSDAVRIIQIHSWPGNVRELYHTLLRAVIWSQSAEVTGQDLQTALMPVANGTKTVSQPVFGGGLTLQEHLDEIARDCIELALKKTGGQKSGAAKLLGFTNHQTLSNWMKRLRMEDGFDG